MTIQEASRNWGISERRVARLCADGKVEGAAKEGRRWIIPDEAEKPADSRIRNGRYSQYQTM